MFMKNKKQKMLVLSLAVVLLVGVGTTIAYLISTPDAVKNVFIPSSVSCAVDEDFANNQVKSNVRVKNTGDIDAYIRAEVVVTWKNENGEIYGATPVLGRDYSMDLGESEKTLEESGWTEKDGFYYCKNKVAKDSFTGILISECKQQQPAPAEGYYLSVEILTSAIQAEGVSDGEGEPAGTNNGESAMESAWDVAPADLNN